MLMPAEVEDYLDAAERLGYLPMFLLALTAGLRQGELIALKWSDLDVTERTLTMLNMKISGEAIERLEEEGFRGPVRKRKNWQLDESYDSRDYQQSLTNYAYAKDLCEHYNFDRNKYRLCVKEKRFAAITKSDFAKLKEDLQFLDNVLKTVLVTYQGYFRERFVDGLSIRKYAEAHQLNRGSVDYQQKKFFSALASLLKERDEAEGTCRLLKPAQK